MSSGLPEASMTSRKTNGEGSIYKRSDGLWAAAFYVDTISGRRKRRFVYGKTRRQAHEKLTSELSQVHKGSRIPDQTWTVGGYLEYWLNNFVKEKRRPRTAELYERHIRATLIPGLGSIRLTALTVQDVQRLLDEERRRGRTPRPIEQIRGVLRSALGRAEREELVLRNVAKLVDVPASERQPITPWTVAEAAQFLDAARGHRWFAGFTLLILCGMRRGEVLGLRWRDIDFANNRIKVRQQLQRSASGLVAGPVKTSAGQRDLPMTPLVRESLAKLAVQRNGGDAVVAQRRATESAGLVFLSTAGTAVEPSRFYREFQKVRRAAGLRHISLHHTRHTAATILKNLRVPERDAQLIFGHAHVTTTQQLYQHADIEGQAAALAQAEQQLLGSLGRPTLLQGTVVVNNLSTGEGMFSHALTLGGASGLRTHDTLLKRRLTATLATLSTSDRQQLRARTRAQILGRAAAVNSCTSPSSPQPRFDPAVGELELMHVLKAADVDVLRRRSFPCSLIAPCPNQQRQRVSA